MFLLVVPSIEDFESVTMPSRSGMKENKCRLKIIIKKKKHNAENPH